MEYGIKSLQHVLLNCTVRQWGRTTNSNLKDLADSTNVDTNILANRLTKVCITAANKAILFRKSQIPFKRKCKKTTQIGKIEIAYFYTITQRSRKLRQKKKNFK